MADIELFHPKLDAVCVVKTEAQAEILKDSGWKKATKEQVEKHAKEAEA